MSKQTIQFLAVRNVTYDRVYRKDSFQLRPSCGWVWLQKLALRALRWRKAYAFDLECHFDKVVIDTKNLFTALLTQKQEIMQTYNLQGQRLLIGAEDFYELQGAANSRFISYPVDFVLNYWEHPNGEISYFGETETRFTGQYRMCGLNVTIVPWMKGMLVVPKEVLP